MGNYEEKIMKALVELERFKEAANKYLIVSRKSRQEEPRWEPYHPKESGALRRASMDLTRALADMRKTRVM